MTRSPAELEPEIEASRQALARDVAALKARATPRRRWGEAVETARGTARVRGRRAGARLLRVAGSRRFQMALVGAILAGAAAWLLARSRRAEAMIVRAPADPKSTAVGVRRSGSRDLVRER